MRLLSFDVGIKNCSYCLFNTEAELKIEKWEIIDLTTCNENVKIEKPKCDFCKNLSKETKDGKFYCLKHSRQTNYKKIPNELKCITLSKNKIADILLLMDKYKIIAKNDNKKPLKKQELLDIIDQYTNENYFDYKKTADINAKTIDMTTICNNIKIKFDKIFTEPINNVIIENQIGPLAIRMHDIQGMITMYFTIKNPNCAINYISAKNKLKIPEIEETMKLEMYKDRKKKGIKYCEILLEKVINDNYWIDEFKSNKKKDDLADCFLQGYWYYKQFFGFVYIFK